MAALSVGLERRLAPLARWRYRARRWGADLADFALPQRCPACGAAAEASRLLCETCRAAIPRLSVAVCARCLMGGAEPVGCVGHSGFQVWPAWVYEERAACVVQALKYEQRIGLAAALGPVLARGVPAASQPDLVMAVPLHRARRRERGYNQAELLAESLAAALAVPCIDGGLVRTRATAPQARLGPRARARNLDGAFALGHPERLKGRRILIVDDVITTGATLASCLDVLADAGAQARGVALAWAQ